MRRRTKVGRNEPCPCGSGKKFKKCCKGEADWRAIAERGGDPTPSLSIRGRNILFVNRVAEALQLDSAPGSLSLHDYKKAFTPQAVREIHEAVVEIWPPHSDIEEILKRGREDVSGLYIGDYQPESLTKGIVRHSIYSNKLLVVDPFLYAPSVRDEYNPILNPDQYRSQTLKNVNLWLSLLPWIEAGIVEVVRTLGDFDSRLNWESMKRQYQKFKESDELRAAADETVKELTERYEEESIRQSLLAAPNEYLEKLFQESDMAEQGLAASDFIDYIERRREQDPDFLAPLGPGGLPAQLHSISSGASYEIGSLTAGLTGSYLVTDIYSKWKEIELDRKENGARNEEWEPFVKAFQEVELRSLNSLSLEHALVLRKEEHLESLRTFLRRVWKAAASDEPFDRSNAQLLGDELKHEIRKAEEEWEAIDRKLLKWFGSELSAGLLAAGPLVASGYGAFVAAAFAVAGIANLGASTSERRAFATRFPAAFFLRLEE